MAGLAFFSLDGKEFICLMFGGLHVMYVTVVGVSVNKPSAVLVDLNIQSSNVNSSGLQ